MNVEPPETLVIIESMVYKSNGFAIYTIDFLTLASETWLMSISSVTKKYFSKKPGLKA